MVAITTTWGLLSLTYALSAEINDFDSANWMRNNMELLGRRTLKQICIPGSHNAGMSKLNGGTAFAKSCNTLTQSRNIMTQLELGIRYFDVRPVISGGTLNTGHYSKLPGGVYQGANGQSIVSIVNEINAFTKDHNEVIIVSLSHSLNTDVGQYGMTKYRAFNQSEWNWLFNRLDQTEKRFFTQWDAYLPNITIDSLTSNGKRSAVIYIINEGGATIGGRMGKGYFRRKNIQLYDQYSETDKVGDMMNDQIRKMRRASRRNYFLLSWTLTQNPANAALCPYTNSISDLANEANKNLYKILPHIMKDVYPNIILLDFIETNEFAELAMDINKKLDF